MGDIPYITTLCLNGALPCVDFMDVIMGDIPYITTLCLSVTLPCVDFMDVIVAIVTVQILRPETFHFMGVITGSTKHDLQLPNMTFNYQT